MLDWLFIGTATGFLMGSVLTLVGLYAIGVIGGDDDDGRA